MKDSVYIVIKRCKSNLFIFEGLLMNKNASIYCNSQFTQCQVLCSPNNDLDNLQEINRRNIA